MPHSLDTENMEQVIAQSPQQFADGLAAADAVALSEVALKTFESILVGGMGGSGMPAALVQEAGLSRVPIHTFQSYGLPVSLNRRTTLVIASSYSGNTEETLAAYDAAKASDFPMMAVSAGGKLQERCRADNVPFVPIPANPPSMQPRSATGYGVGILVGLLDRMGLAAEGARQAIEKLPAFLARGMDDFRREAAGLVPSLVSATPVVYASWRHANVARIWKIKFNENAKTPAFWNAFPELNHNEMTGWLHPHGPFHLIVLSDPDEDPRIRKRETTTRQLLEARASLKSTVVNMPGTTTVEKIFGTLLIGDWTSYLVALELGEDPSPVDLVEEFKGLLEEP